MGIGNVPSVVLYAYPLLLYAVRLLCPLLFRHTIEHHESKRRKNLLSGIWYLQLILSSLLVRKIDVIRNCATIDQSDIGQARNRYSSCSRIHFSDQAERQYQNGRGSSCTYSRLITCIDPCANRQHK